MTGLFYALPRFLNSGFVRTISLGFQSMSQLLRWLFCRRLAVVGEHQTVWGNPIFWLVCSKQGE
jgi:hypothetical protein